MLTALTACAYFRLLRIFPDAVLPLQWPTPGPFCLFIHQGLFSSCGFAWLSDALIITLLHACRIIHMTKNTKIY